MSYPDSGSMTIPADPPQERKTAGLSITALVLGVLGFLVITIPISIIIGIVAMVKKTQKLKVLAVIGIVLSILWIVAYGAIIAGGVNLFNNKIANADVKVGDCIGQDKDTGLVTKVTCGQGDVGKVYAIPVLPEGDFPGSTQVQKAAEKACLSASGKPADESTISYVSPSEALWKLGHREVFCAAKTK
ncbi:hypothetical protein [Fodinicola acaciae]|uniref:hypothetical protein n=1 Tax=Fodinicola acaciae TaxID=2681555 RepID=UPI0013D1171C|nr:hypothetical protein [Fodinicola acaciae]